MIQRNAAAKKRHPWSGLTLLELLLTLTIIAFLAGLIFPALSRVQSQTRSISCLANLREWGLATQLFATENDDFLPKDGAPNGGSLQEGWYVDLPRALALPPYHAMPWRTNDRVEPGPSIWICPSNPRRSNGHNLFHYCLNQHVNRAGSGNQVRLGSIAHPETAVWLFDNGKLAAVAQQNNVHTNLHRMGAQFVFLDGHAAWFAARDYWDFTENRGRTNHSALVWRP